MLPPCDGPNSTHCLATRNFLLHVHLCVCMCVSVSVCVCVCDATLRATFITDVTNNTDFVQTCSLLLPHIKTHVFDISVLDVMLSMNCVTFPKNL